MKTKGVIGKRIVAIQQEVRRDGHGIVTVSVYGIKLENGWILRPVVREMENDYAVEFVIHKPK